MKKLFFSFVLVFAYVLCFGQNTAIEYMEKPSLVLKDAEKAFRNSEYDKTVTLINNIYIPITGKHDGDILLSNAKQCLELLRTIEKLEINNEQRTLYQYYETLLKINPSDQQIMEKLNNNFYALENKADSFFREQKYINAFYVYLTSFKHSPSKENTYSKLELCAKEFLNNITEISADTLIGNKIFDVYSSMTSSKSVNNSIGILQIAALHGNSKAARITGQYFMGEKDFNTAIFYYLKTQENNDVLNDIGWCYSQLANSASESSLKYQYYKKAYEFFIKTANLGNKIGQYNVGSLILDGKGVEQNILAAREWFQKSHENGYEKAKERLRYIDGLISDSTSETNLITVNGHVREHKEPIVGAAILNDGKQLGTVSDMDGKYSLRNVSPNGTITFSCFGYSPKKVNVRGRTSIDVTLHKNYFFENPIVGVSLVSDFKSYPIGLKGDFLWGIIHLGVDASVGSFIFNGTASRVHSSITSPIIYNGQAVEPTIEYVGSEYEKSFGSFAYTITPGIFYKYVSIDCGLGQIFTRTSRIDNYKYTYDASSVSENENVEVSSTLTTVGTKQETAIEKKSYFVYKPGISAVIGNKNENAFIISARYRICPNDKSLNGFELSLGMTFAL